MPSDLEEALFSERLWPSPGIWAVAGGFGAALGLIVGPISAELAWIVGGIGLVAFVTLLGVTTPSLTVTEQTLTAGRARVPLSVVSAIEVLDPAKMRQARGVELDARAYLCIRGWLPAGAKVTLTDPEDPTPYWLLSSRRPEALATVLRAEIERVGRTA
jgi:hypothetical protein